MFGPPITVPIVPISSTVSTSQVLIENLEGINAGLRAAGHVAYNHTPPGKNLKAIIELPGNINAGIDKAKDYATIAVALGVAYVGFKLIQEGRKAFA